MVSLGLLEHEVPAGGASDTPEHRRLTREAAREGVVLLKNERTLLPLDANRIRSIAVIGPNAAVARLGGGGSAQVIPPYSVSPLEGIKQRVGEKIRVEYAPGVVALEDTDAVPSENLRTPDGKSNGLQGEYFTNMKLAGEPAFQDLNLHRVYVYILASNAAARRMCENAGFRLEGTTREAAFKDGTYHDVHLMGVLPPEFRAE